MSKTVEVTMIKALKGLARSGLARAEGQHYCAYGKGQSSPVRISRNQMQAMLAEGWAADGGDAGVVITRAGRDYLRKRKCEVNTTVTAHYQADSNPGINGNLKEKPKPLRCVARNLDESPLSWLRSRKGRDGKPLLSVRQFEAGERLRTDFERAHLTSAITMNWSTLATGYLGKTHGTATLDDTALGARDRLTRALEAVGSDFTDLLLDVCCFLKRLETVERERHWPQRSAKLVLGLGLNALARHYEDR